MKEQIKYELVKRFIDNGERNIKRLSSLMKCSLKTAYNLVNKYKERGKEGFVHGNHVHKPTTTKSETITSTILRVYKEISDVTNVNFTHFNEILKRDYSINVSYTFLMQLLSQNGYYSPKCHRSTRRKKNQIIKAKLEKGDKLTSFEQNVVADFLLDSDEAHPRKERSKYFGELIQMDASVDRWFVNSKSYLHAAIDEDNKYLADYVKEFNKQFALPYKDNINCFERQLENTNIDEYLAVVSHRKVDNGATIRYKNKYYKFYNDKGDVVCPRPKSECLVIQKFTNELVALFEQTVFHLEEFKTHREDSIM